MTIITNDGVVLQGSPDEIVTALREAQRLEVAHDNATYMAAVVRRVRLWQGQKLPRHDAGQFLDGLHAAALIEVLDA